MAFFRRRAESIGDSRSNHQIGMYHGLNKRYRLLGGYERLNLWPLVGARKLGGTNGLIGYHMSRSRQRQSVAKCDLMVAVARL